ncbi:MAG: uroporphyrinogen decarboxylase family protein [Candidatus Helarchaeales archaeon]
MSQPSPRKLYKERNQRVKDAISLKEPDRVPITPMSTFFPTEQKGLSKKVAMYEPEKLVDAAVEVFTPYNWDQGPPIMNLYPGPFLDSLDATFFKWPGALNEKYRLRDDQPYQFVEGERMKASEYEDFFQDPTGFLLRNIIPQHYIGLEGFKTFPALSNLASPYGVMLAFPFYFGLPPGSDLLRKLQESTKLFFTWLGALTRYENEMKKRGFPIQFMNLAQAPFDLVSEFLRGMKGAMLDMYRKPEELKKLMDMLVEPTIETTVSMGKMNPKYDVVFIPLHRGAEGFMNDKQFETFYWPTLTRVMDGLIKNNLIPMPFFEGKYTARFKYLAEFAREHKGKVIYWFDQSDMIKAKEMFGEHACIRGNVPGSLLVAGTTKQVEEYVKKIIHECAEGGGLLIDGGISGIPDEAKAENVKAMTEAVFKYGYYRK